MLFQHDSWQHDKRPLGSAWSDSDARYRFGLAIRCGWSWGIPRAEVTIILK